MLLLIDNYDSFTFNLVQAFGTLEPALEIRVVRNDEITIAEIEAHPPTWIVLSPGPCTPTEAGICNAIIPAFRGRIPILGVCLGHQCIGEAHAMKIVRAAQIMHGKTSPIHHDGIGLFAGLPNPFRATRYHSLLIDPDSFNAREFTISAWTADGTIMGLRWRGAANNGTGSGTEAGTSATCNTGQAPLEGVQFHPESFLTTDGPQLLANFLGMKQPSAL